MTATLQAVLDDIDLACKQLREMHERLQTEPHSDDFVQRAKHWSTELVEAVRVARAEFDAPQRPVLYLIR